MINHSFNDHFLYLITPKKLILWQKKKIITMIIQNFLSDFSCLDEELNRLSAEINEPILRADLAKKIINQAIDKIYTTIIETTFEDENDEISFFKSVFPLFLSRLFYFNCLFNIETHKPVSGKKELKKYLNAQLEILNNFYKEHKEFYTYYRSDSVFSDHLYFTRNDFDTSQNVSSIHYLIDKRFFTKHTYLIAKIISNDLISEYIESSLLLLKNVDDAKINKNQSTPTIQKTTWSGSKVGLIELAYALKEEGSINGGNMEVKEIIEMFETFFDISLGQYGATFIELRQRKKGKTKFLDSLRENCF